MASYISSVSMDALSNLCGELEKNNTIKQRDFERYDVKRGLRNSDGTGVMAGLTNICSVEGYYILDGERVPKEGKLSYRGYDIKDLVSSCIEDDRFVLVPEGAAIPDWKEDDMVVLQQPLTDMYVAASASLDLFDSREVIGKCRALPNEFVEDSIMKHPSKDIMNKMARSVMTLYSHDENPDDISITNVLRQEIQLIAQFPTIMNSAYQVKRRAFYNKSMYLHPIKEEISTAEFILRQIRADKKYSNEEARLLDICLMLHADHGGGNNSTFSTRALTSSGTDTYSAITAGLGSLKGPRHGGANIKVVNMFEDMEHYVKDWENEDEVANYLTKLLRKEVFDRQGLIYGMGHAIYTLSDPRAVIIKEKAEKLLNELFPAEQA